MDHVKEAAESLEVVEHVSQFLDEHLHFDRMLEIHHIRELFPEFVLFHFVW